MAVLYQCIQTRVLRTSIYHEFCKLLIKRPQTVMFSNNIQKINVKNLENCEKSLCKSCRTILYQRIQTLIELVFLFNNPHELLMSLIIAERIEILSTTFLASHVHHCKKSEKIFSNFAYFFVVVIFKI